MTQRLYRSDREYWDELQQRINRYFREREDELIERELAQYGYVKERTCKMELMIVQPYVYRCSHCEEPISLNWHIDNINYCPKCGARVVE